MTETKSKFAASIFPGTGRLYVRDDEFSQYTGAYALDTSQVDQVQAILAEKDALPNSLRDWLDDHAEDIGHQAGIYI